MWYHGYGKIAVVPSVNLEYTDEAAKKIKATKGYVSRWTDSEGQNDMPVNIEWESVPPPTVKCMPSYSNQTWPPWDEGLKEKGIVP
jgi:alpha-1,3-mannosyltransferase